MQNIGSLAIVQQALQNFNRTISVWNWLTDEAERAATVEVVRRYVNAAPDNFLTTAQRTMLNLSPNSAAIHQFSDNYCPAILATSLDRIRLTGIQAGKVSEKKAQRVTTNSAVLSADTEVGDTAQEIAQDWIDDLLQVNRLDELQVNLHEAALRDGNAFLMVDAIRQSDDSTLIRLTQEPAYDGFYGMVVMYETAQSKQPSLAAKVWRITTPNVGDTVRLNMYYPNRIERYIGFIGGGLRPYGKDTNFDLYPQPVNPMDGQEAKPLAVDPESPVGFPPGPDDDEDSVIPWTIDQRITRTPDGHYDIPGEPIGVPVIHFRNKGNNITTHGLSELQDVIPLQDLLNRTLYDMAATSALSAFGVRWLIGNTAPTSIQPGDIRAIYATDPNDPTKVAVPNEDAKRWLDSIRLLESKQADMVPYISQADWIKNEMFAVTNTPEMENASANASGESLRQREVKLIGKVKRFEVRNGNAWEDAMLMCARVQSVFSSEKPPTLGVLNAKWEDPEIRNDTVTQANALLLYTNGLTDQRTCLEQIKDIYEWDNDDIDAIIAETEKARGQNQINANDAAAVMQRLKAGQTPPQANGKTGGTTANGANGDQVDPSTQGTQVQQPIKTPTVVTKGTLTTSGEQTTPGA